MRKFSLSFALFVATVAACSSNSSSPSTPDADSGVPDSGLIEDVVDAGPPVPLGDGGLGICGSEFGNKITPGFGRLDGTLIAIVRPVDTACPLPNGTHVVLQVRVDGALYRMVANVQSDRVEADIDVRFAEHPAALPAPAWGEGWHLGAPLDYVATLNVHNADFSPLKTDALVAQVVSELHVGDPISVYATSGAGNPGSAHLIHRNASNADGAIVVAPTSASPKFLLFHFSEQVF